MNPLGLVAVSAITYIALTVGDVGLRARADERGR
jgi:hypothetical protein